MLPLNSRGGGPGEGLSDQATKKAFFAASLMNEQVFTLLAGEIKACL